VTVPAHSSATDPGWLLIAGIVGASLTEALAGTALTLPAAEIAGDVHATPDELAWLGMAYTAAKLIGFAFTPWLLARVEPRRALVLATLAMGVASCGAAFSVSLGPLIVLRTHQGVAGAVLLVAGQAILFMAYSAARQPVIQALFAIGAVVAPATIAPALQGWLVDSRSWSWVFFGGVPVSLVAAGLLISAGSPRLPAAERRPFDGIGLVPFGVALLALSYLLGQGSRWNWFETSRIVWAVLIAAAGLALFATRQAMAPRRALFDLSIFAVADFAFAFVVSFVAGAALFGSAYLIPAFAVSLLAFTPTAAGFLLLPSSGLFAASLLLAAWLMQARGLPPIATVPLGILLVMAAMALLAGSNSHSDAADMMPAILLRGLGLGFLFLSITLIAFSGLPRAGLAMGIAIFDIGRQLGGLIGVAGLQTMIDHRVAANEAILSAVLAGGTPAVEQRLATVAAFLAERGMDAAAATRTATALLGRALGGQATAIAFDSAFAAVALLFVAAAPAIVAVRVLLIRLGQRRMSSSEGERA
jgi:DHA2 family multidrug resistance protein